MQSNTDHLTIVSERGIWSNVCMVEDPKGWSTGTVTKESCHFIEVKDQDQWQLQVIFYVRKRVIPPISSQRAGTDRQMVTDDTDIYWAVNVRILFTAKAVMEIEGRTSDVIVFSDDSGTNHTYCKTLVFGLY